MLPSRPTVKHANRLAKRPVRRPTPRRTADADIAAAGFQELKERGLQGLFAYAHSPGQAIKLANRLSTLHDPVVREGVVHDLSKFYAAGQAREATRQPPLAADATERATATPTEAAYTTPVSASAAVTVPWSVYRCLMGKEYTKEDDATLFGTDTPVVPPRVRHAHHSEERFGCPPSLHSHSAACIVCRAVIRRMV